MSATEPEDGTEAAYPWASTWTPLTPYPETPTYLDPPIADTPPAAAQPSQFLAPPVILPNGKLPRLPRPLRASTDGSPRWVTPPAQIPSRRHRVVGIVLVLALLVCGAVAITRSLTGNAAPLDLTSEAAHIISTLELIGSCTASGGDTLDLSVQITNNSSETLTLTGTSVAGMPSTVHVTGPVLWTAACGYEGGTANPPLLASGGQQWLTVRTTLTASCPVAASPTVTITYRGDTTSGSATMPLTTDGLRQAIQACGH